MLSVGRVRSQPRKNYAGNPEPRGRRITEQDTISAARCPPPPLRARSGNRVFSNAEFRFELLITWLHKTRFRVPFCTSRQFPLCQHFSKTSRLLYSTQYSSVHYLFMCPLGANRVPGVPMALCCRISTKRREVKRQRQLAATSVYWQLYSIKCL